MVLELQVIGLLFTLVMLYLTYLYYRKDNYGVRSLAIWVCVWLGGGLLLLFPQWFRGLAQGLRGPRLLLRPGRDARALDDLQGQ